MSRPLRVEFPGALYHVSSRGNGGRLIYLGRDDCETYLGILGATLRRFGWMVHTYCLMGNHYHLVVETPRPNLGRGMRHLNGVYAQEFNRRHNTFGHLYQGRYGAVLVEKESHLLETVRYVVLNPVRAGLCEQPGDWPWSSYRALAGRADDPIVFTDWVLGQFADSREIAHGRFARFVAEGLPRRPIPPHGGLYAGSAPFALTNAPGTPLREIPRSHCLPVSRSLEDVFTQPEDTAIVSAYRDHGYRLAQIGEHLGLHYSTVSRRLRAVEDRQRKT